MSAQQNHDEAGPCCTDCGADVALPSLVIGWREPVSLPDWGIRSIKTKIDTGARTSAIHVDNLQLLPGNRVGFDVIVAIGRADKQASRVAVQADVVRISRVRLSHGRRQRRPVVATRIRLGPVERTIELSLVSRNNMLCRMLLGRMALRGNFLVDPGKARRLPRRTQPPRGTTS